MSKQSTPSGTGSPQNRLHFEEEPRDSTFEKRRVFFERNKRHRNRFCTCPACGYPTLRRREAYEACPLCHWEDDGRDKPGVDDEPDAPNHVSLAQARRNFSQAYSIWSHDEQGDFSPENWQRVFAPVVQRRKQHLCRLYDALMDISDIEQIRRLWGEIRYCLRNRSCNS
jgi:uncharacterized Zn finger protein (UPF0148 family)